MHMGIRLLLMKAICSFKNCIMTPHLGEFSRLIDTSINFIEKHYVELAIQFAVAHNVVLV